MPEPNEMTDSPRIDVERLGSIAWVIFNNPSKHNATTLKMLGDLASIMGELETAPDVRAIVLRGAGGRAFVSGSDVSEFPLVRSTPDQIAAYKLTNERAVGSVQRCSKPTIAMVEGWCLGGGLVIALACDFRICSETAVFAAPGARLGIAYSYEDLSHLTGVVGQTVAKDIVFTGRRFTAADALQMRLVSSVAPAGAIRQTVEDYAQTIGANAPLSLHAAKLAIETAAGGGAQGEIAKCQAAIARCDTSEDYLEGQRAFKEKRKPSFVGR